MGCSIGRYLMEQGTHITGYYSRSKESVDNAATFVSCKAFYSLEEFVTNCDVIWITTPDDAIVSVWMSLQSMSISNKIICHFSGSLSSVVFSGREKYGVSACSIHPMYAFSDKNTCYRKLNTVLFTMEGDKEALEPMKALFESFHNRVCVIAPENKIRYHMAAAMASNLMAGLYQMSADALKQAGFDDGSARDLLEPLVRNNIDKILSDGPEAALTGPLERGDVHTVQAHINELTPEEKAVYIPLSKKILEIARRKNPDRDYAAMSRLLDE